MQKGNINIHSLFPFTLTAGLHFAPIHVQNEVPHDQNQMCCVQNWIYRMYACMHASMYLCMYGLVYMHVICMYMICMYLYMYLCIYVVCVQQINKKPSKRIGMRIKLDHACTHRPAIYYTIGLIWFGLMHVSTAGSFNQSKYHLFISYYGDKNLPQT